jgi:membrane fusion protein, copper/silver efflux system
MGLALKTVARWVTLLLAIGGIILAVTYWPRGSRTSTASAGIWTCSMHPQIRLDHFDRCPICGMDLVPAVQRESAGSDLGSDHLALGPHERRMARVGTTKLEMRTLLREIRTVGRIDFDETRRAQIASRVDGRVDQVFADFPGTLVKKGDHLVSIYSPELLSTQEEFLSASRREKDQKSRPANTPSLAASARRRLRLWGISDQQIDTLLENDAADTHLIVYAPIGGTVVEKMVRAGQYVKEGDTLYSIADLSHVWLVVEIYETDLAWVRFGQTVEVTLEAESSASFTGQVGFIDPVLNDQTRTVPIRVILKNDQGKLKPGMFAQALIRVAVMPDGRPAPTGLEGKFSCPMHPYIVSDMGGICPVCEMALETIPGTAPDLDGPPMVLAIPSEAVLTTGQRQLVFVDHGEGGYQLIEPRLGPRAGDYYPVLDGLKAGDFVVSRGNFLIDSQFQISGKPSLLYPEGMAASGHAGHRHGPATKESASDTNQSAARETMARNVGRLPPDDRQLARTQGTCPVTGKELGSMGVPVRIEVEGKTVFLCCAGCTPIARKDPQTILKKLVSPNPPARDGKHRH